ncbi:LysR family transcriptional regulator [Paraferrimonas sedimenticola]|uniref:LysR family transcriptional regulator n=1 Tax=Paraferrimonas sedimenticola TaxID=375674 RepID=A0AA37RUX0_9GAMM|nr:LysR family transcriptional regulator [Paraferrimonas sedimenticola]GLP96035.1 LysR family transcriptional regulator [Paraferrimonas sedimenticola]
MNTPTRLQLETLVCAAESGSFSEAARRLKRSQATVSQTIANLEIDLNLVLFDRSQREPRLTSAGEMLLNEAKLILSRFEYFGEIANRLTPNMVSEFVLAGEVQVQLGDDKALIERLIEKFPETNIHIWSGSSASALQNVIDGQAQVGLVFSHLLLPEEIDFQPLKPTQWLTVCSPEHPLASQSSVSLSELTLHRQVSFTEPYKQDLAKDRLSSKAWRVNGFITAYKLTLSGHFWMRIPRDLVASELELGIMVEIALDDELSQSVECGLIWRRDNKEHPVILEVLDVVRTSMV